MAREDPPAVQQPTRYRGGPATGPDRLPSVFPAQVRNRHHGGGSGAGLEAPPPVGQLRPIKPEPDEPAGTAGLIRTRNQNEPVSAAAVCYSNHLPAPLSPLKHKV